MEELYRGEFPAHEQEKIESFLSEGGWTGGAIDLPPLRAAIDRLRELSEAQVNDGVYNAGSGSEFTSNQLYRAHRFKHSRLKKKPEDKFSEPVTTQQFVSYCCPAFASA